MGGSDKLGTAHETKLSCGRIRYHERGEGPPIVFVHGIFAGAGLWRDVVPGVADAGFRCITPEWPLGAHRIPMPHADLAPPAMAGMIAEFLERMDLDDVTIVANDTGGAYVQILMANRPERVGRVVLTPCDAFERFFPPMFALLPALMRIPGAVDVTTALLRWEPAQRLPMTFGWLAKYPFDVNAFLDRTYDADIRDDLRRALLGVHRRHTLAAVDGLRRFAEPVLLAWAIEDRVFPISLAHRLAGVLPDARIVGVPDAYTLVPLDQPARLADLVVEFAGARAAS